MATRQELINEIEKLNKTIEDTNIRKEQALLNLGIYIYQKVREGLLQNNEIDEICKPIIGFDHVIYDAKFKIYEYKNDMEDVKCSCGNTLGQNDKFCSVCGEKVKIEKNYTEYIKCNRCLSTIDRNSRFCPSCGIKK